MSAWQDRETGAREALKADLAATKSLNGKLTDMDRNAAVARRTVNEEMGRYGDPDVYYELNTQSADILLSHARQDAAHALLNTITIWKQLRSVKRLLSVPNPCW